MVKMVYKSISGKTWQSSRKSNKKQWSNYMHLNLILPVVNPDNFTQPEKCPEKKSGGKHFTLRQEALKAIRDSKLLKN
jgi:hypothetical protein